MNSGTDRGNQNLVRLIAWRDRVHVRVTYDSDRLMLGYEIARANSRGADRHRGLWNREGGEAIDICSNRWIRWAIE
jgi:hypothetical protein